MSLADGAEVVEQRGEHRFDRRRLGRLQQRQRARADPWRHRPQRGDHVGPEGRGIVVARVERQPRGGPLIGRRGRSAASHSASSVVLPKPAGAETSINFDAAPAVQSLAQSRTRHQTTSRPGDIELRLEQGRRRARHHRLLLRARHVVASSLIPLVPPPSRDGSDPETGVTTSRELAFVRPEGFRTQRLGS